MHPRQRLRAARRVLAVTLTTLAFCACVHAQSRAYEIPAGDLKGALEAYAAQSGVQLVYKIEDVRGLSTKGVQRTTTPEQALQSLIEGTPLKVRRDAAGAVALVLTSAGAGPRDFTQLEAVVVSANRRREPVGEVPLRIDVLPAEQLQRSGAKSLSDYLLNEPGVDIRSSGGAGYGAISVRGVSTGTQTIPTVGVYVDDVAVGSSSAFARGSLLFLDLGLLDLNHVELLRGPQGTLYGASSMGGLLKYVTNQPDTTTPSGKIALSGSTTKGGNESGTASFAVNVPLKEDFAALRISAYEDHQTGWVTGVGPAGGSGVNHGSSTGARASLLVTPDTDLSIRLSATLQDIHRSGNDFVDYNPVTAQPVYGELSHAQSVREPYKVNTNLYSAEIEYNFGWARLNSITSYQDVNHQATIDISPIYVPLVKSAFGLNLANVYITTPVRFGRTAQEFRLTSKSDQTFEWLAGFYYDHETGSNQQFGETTLPNGAAGPELANVKLSSRYKEYAGFGDVTWKFTPTLSATVGLRVSRNEQHYEQYSGNVLSAVPTDSADTSKTYLVTGRYLITPTSNVYVRVATGYRPGGPNAAPITPAGPVAAPPNFDHDSLTSYEIGYKADLLNKLVSVETAVYDIEWRNLQQINRVNLAGAIINIGKARSKGAEVSATVRPLPSVSVSANVGYTDAALTEDALGAKAGARLPNTALWSGSVAGNYTFRIADYAAYAGGTVRLVADRNAGLLGAPATSPYRTPGYSLTDLQTGVDYKGYSIGLFVRNVFDKRAQLSDDSSLQSIGGNALVSVAQPRTFGVNLSAAF